MSHLAAVVPTLASVVLPVFGLIAIGRLLVRFRFVDAAGTKGLTGVIFWVLLPALLFLSLVGNPAPLGLAVVGVYFGVAVPLFAASVLCGLALLRLSVAQSAVLGLNAAYGNTVLLGIPIVGAAWGATGLATLLSIIAAHSLVLLPAATVLVALDRGEERPARRHRLARVVAGAVAASLKNPIIAAILAAVVWRWLGLPVPGVFRRCLELLAQAAPAMSLIFLGASLPALRLASVGSSVLFAVAIKLVVLPLGVALAVGAAAIPAPASSVMILTAALPTGANAFLLAHRAGAMMEVSATTVVVATLLASLTLTAILALLA
jgi:malonate transporter and related proteins